MTGKTCNHPACSCSVGPEEKYCSERCREWSHDPLPEVKGCACLHTECLGAAGRKGDAALERRVESG